MELGGLRVSRFSVYVMLSTHLHSLHYTANACLSSIIRHYNIACACIRACICCIHTLTERLSMSWEPTPYPPEVLYLQKPEAAHVLTYEQFLHCARTHVLWLNAEAERAGLPNLGHQRLEEWVKPGDLQTFVDVVKWWPKPSPQFPAPTLYDMVASIRPHDSFEATTFIDYLDLRVERVREWCRRNRINPDNPNESKSEREARLNRERVARHRLRHAPGSDDPEEQALIERAKAAEENASQGRKWLKGAIQQEKLNCAKDIQARKAQRDKTIVGYEKAVADAEQAALDAKAVLDAYRIKK